MKVTARLNNLRISPRKVRLLRKSIEGIDVDEALINLKNIIKRSSFPLEKLLRSAIANAENNFGLDKDNLYIFEIQVGEGTKMKRWLPRAYGRATPLIKRNSNVVLMLEERIEGKNRKSKEQLEKEKKEREENRKKMEQEIMKERGQSEDIKKAEKDKLQSKKETVEKESKKTQKSGWMNKIFRRKSM